MLDCTMSYMLERMTKCYKNGFVTNVTTSNIVTMLILEHSKMCSITHDFSKSHQIKNNDFLRVNI